MEGSDSPLKPVLAQLEEAGTGPAAALVVVVAARLVEEAARGSVDAWGDAGGAVAQALALRERGQRLAVEDAEAYRAARAALDAVPDHAPFRQPGDPSLGPALERAASVPLEIAEAGADVAALAATVAEHARPDVRANAAGAAALAAGAVSASAHLVDINLTTRPDDERTVRARDLVELAQQASKRAQLGSLGG